MTSPGNRRNHAPLPRRGKLGGEIGSGAKSGPMIIRPTDAELRALRKYAEATGDYADLREAEARRDVTVPAPQVANRRRQIKRKTRAPITAEEWQAKRREDAEAKKANQAECARRMAAIREGVKALDWAALDLTTALQAVYDLDLAKCRVAEQREAIRTMMKGHTLQTLDAGRRAFLRAMTVAAGESVSEIGRASCRERV